MIHNVDALTYLQDCKSYRCIFADIPDNINYPYIGFCDQKANYIAWIKDLIQLSLDRCDIFWLSYNQMWDLQVKYLALQTLAKTGWDLKQIIWRFTFGQYNDRGFASGYRPILCFKKPNIDLNYDAIRIESARMKLGDKRAAGPRVPDDVWDFPRVVGNAKERRSWHPTQHPEALMERILKLSCTTRLFGTHYHKDIASGSVLDPFMGSGTTLIVAKRLGIDCDGCEISKFYCKMLEDLC